MGTGWLVRYGSGRLAGVILVAVTALVDTRVDWGAFGFLPRALVDEPLHLATAVIALGAYTRWRGRPPGRYAAWGTLAASVLIDLDHLPQEFGAYTWTDGTPRPYTHALWVIVVLAAIAAVAGRRARAGGGVRAAVTAAAATGAAWGVALHFLRDAATAPIALWWPVSSAGIQVPYLVYLVPLLLLAVVPPRRTAPGSGGRREEERVSGGARV
jgi:inner membrane protein